MPADLQRPETRAIRLVGRSACVLPRSSPSSTSLPVLTLRAVQSEEVALVAVCRRLLINEDELTLLERAEPLIPANFFEPAVSLLRERDAEHPNMAVMVRIGNGGRPAAALLRPGTDDLRAARGQCLAGAVSSLLGRMDPLRILRRARELVPMLFDELPVLLGQVRRLDLRSVSLFRL